MLLQKIKDVWSQKRVDLEEKRRQVLNAVQNYQAELDKIDAEIAELEAEIIEVDTLEIKK